MIDNVKDLLELEMLGVWETETDFYVFPNSEDYYDETMYKVEKRTGAVEPLGYPKFIVSIEDQTRESDLDTFRRAFS